MLGITKAGDGNSVLLESHLQSVVTQPEPPQQGTCSTCLRQTLVTGTCLCNPILAAALIEAGNFSQTPVKKKSAAKGCSFLSRVAAFCFELSTYPREYFDVYNNIYSLE